jgi:glycosyltransferase involved in cell wall biosynthesis
MKSDSIIFYCHWGALCYEGLYYLPKVHNLYVRSAKSEFGSVKVITKCENISQKPGSNYEVVSGVEFLPVTHFSSYFTSLKALPEICKIARFLGNNVSNATIYLRSPEPYSWLFWLFNRGQNTLVYHFASNPVEAILQKQSENIALRILKCCLFLPELLLISFAAKRNKITVNGAALKNSYRRLLGSRIQVLNESSLTEKSLIEIDCLVNSKPPKTTHLVNLLFVGYLRPAKGLDILFEALSRIKDNGTEFHLNIVGAGESLTELKKSAASLNISQMLTFHGEIGFGADLFQLYNMADAFVLPSRSEGSPRVVLESMVFRVPVIATRVGNIPNILAENRGMLMDVDNVDQLCSLLESFSENSLNGMFALDDAQAYAKSYTIEKFFKEIALIGQDNEK